MEKSLALCRRSHASVNCMWFVIEACSGQINIIQHTRITKAHFVSFPLVQLTRSALVVHASRCIYESRPYCRQ